MLSSAYLLAEFCFDKAENEPAKKLQHLANFPNFANPNRNPNPNPQVAILARLAAGQSHRRNRNFSQLLRCRCMLCVKSRWRAPETEGISSFADPDGKVIQPADLELHERFEIFPEIFRDLHAARDI